MLSKTSILPSVVVLAAAALLACLPSTNGACLNGDVPACPAQDEITPVQDGYDAAAVDWNAVVADIYSITDAEPRVCTMSIRAWFHDLGGHQPPEGEVPGLFRERFFPSIAGSDASILTHVPEKDEAASAGHGFAQVVRHVLVQLAAAHGVSHADLLTIFAATCPQRMGATVDIPAHCEAQNFPLYVGKADYQRPDNHNNYKIHSVRANQLPQAHTRLPGLYSFFMDDINAQISEARWKLDQTDSTALMGAHGIMMTQNCMTDGEQPDTPPDMVDRTCSGDGGRQRMFHWSNHYWQDLTSGRCEQNDETKAGRDLTAAEDAQFTQCSWNTMEGFELGEILECDSMNTVESSGAVDMSRENTVGHFSDGWKAGRWEPDPENPPAACCGYTCQNCEENADSKFWCGGNIEGGHRFFPYGYLDCDWNRAYRYGSSYCSEAGGQLCDNQSPQLMAGVAPIMDKYRNSASAWEEDYAVAFCKFSNFGANYTDSKASFDGLFSGPTTGCVDASDVLSPKECSSCQIAGRDPSVHQGGSPISPGTQQPVVSAPPPVTPPAAAPSPAPAPAVEEEEDPPTVVEETDTDTDTDTDTADVISTTETEPLNATPDETSEETGGDVDDDGGNTDTGGNVKTGGKSGGSTPAECGVVCKFMAKWRAKSQ